MHKNELDTPVAVVDLDRMEANIGKLQQYLDKHAIANRPHIKTHKIPEIARMQIAAGAVGITCQKVGEAEVMAAGGITDILITYNIVGQKKLARLMKLAQQVTLAVTADSLPVINGLALAAEAAQTELTVLVECDTGGERCGVQSPEEALLLARLINDAHWLHFGGLMIYPNNENLDPFVQRTSALLAPHGIGIERVSGGGTPQMWQAHTHQELTEHRAGMYLFGDRYTLRSGALTLDDCAFYLLATVVSRPTDNRGILDSGSKSLSSDLLGLDGHGLILEYPDARIYGLSEEHGHVDFSACPDRPEIGERVTIIPNHCCVVTNLFDELVGLRGDEVEKIWPVAARGTVK